MSVLIRLRDIDNLSPAEDAVRKYFLQNKEAVLDLTTQQIGEATFTSASTVVRLCKRLDVGGFTKFKMQLIKEMETLNNMHLEILDSTMIGKDDTEATIVDKITSMNIQSIEETKIMQNISQLNDIVNEIDKAQVIDFFGVGSSHIVALDASYKFMRVGKLVANYALYDRQIVQAINADKNHFAFIFSYSGETDAMIRVANELNSNGVQFVSVTANRVNSLADLSPFNLYVSMKETIFRSAAMSSRTASLYLIDLIYILFSTKNYEESAKKISRTRINSKE